MLKGIRSLVLRTACFGVAALTFGGAASQAWAQDSALQAATTEPVVAEPEKSPFTFSAGTDFTSHFISYGFDVWGGGNNASPFDSTATVFSYATVTCAFTDNLSGFVNLWGDINNNADSSIGNCVQEIDLNIGLTYTVDKFAFTAAHGFWMYANDTEGIIDLSASYSDGGQFTGGFAINPTVVAHCRYQGNGAQDTGVAIVPGIKPTLTFMKEGKYPLSVFVPVNVAFFTDDFQGGDGGYGYFSAGVGVSVPLAFIPEKFGTWNVNASAIYYNTPSEAIPTNPEENFVVTSVGIGMSF